MATIYTREQEKALRGDGPMEAWFFQDHKKYHVVRPNTKAALSVRVYPQFASDGTVLPLVLSQTKLEAGDGTETTAYEFSNLEHAVTATFHGLEKGGYFTGLSLPSDDPSVTKFDSPIGGTFFKLNKMKKDKKVPAEYVDLVDRLLSARGPNNFSKPCSGPDDTYFVRCAVLVENGQRLPKPIMNGLLPLKGPSARAYSKALERAHLAGIDPVGPQGVPFTFGALPKNEEEGRNTAMSTCVRGMTPFNGAPDTIADIESKAKPMPVPPEVMKAHYTDVTKDFKRYTYRELMTAAIKAYTADAVRLAFPEKFAEHMAAVGESVAATTKQQVSTPPTVKADPPKEVKKQDPPADASAFDFGSTAGDPAPRSAPKTNEAKSNPANAADDMEAEYERMLAEGNK